MNGEHRYNIPMFGVKHWYQHEMEAVGHLASMEDAYLRRMYASKVVNGMNHLTKAIEEKIVDPGYQHKKRDLELMKNGVKRTMDHLKKDYDVTEGNISYKWNSGTNKNMPSSFEPKMNTLPSFNKNTLSLNTEEAPLSENMSLNENTLSLNTEEPSLNENMPVLTLNNMKNFTTAKIGNTMNKKNTLNLKKNTLNLNKNTLNLNKNTLNLNKNNTLNVNKNTLNLNNKNTLNLNKNTLNVNKNAKKNKNTLIGGRRRKNRKGRHTRRR